MRALLLVALLLASFACRRDDDDPEPTPAPTDASGASVTPEASAALSDTPTPVNTALPDGPAVHNETLTHDGRERSYRLYTPGSLDGAPVPLVIGLHGGFGSGEQFADTTRFDAQAQAGHFIAVYPDGTGAIPTWNGGRCCGAAAREDVDDVGFIAALIDEVAAQYPIDADRVYAVGHSNGAIIALRLACELSDRIAAVGAVAGSLEIADCAPDEPVSVVLVHGDADENHPLEGGRGPRSVANVDFMSVADSMRALAKAMDCAPEPFVEGAGSVIFHSHADCPEGVSVLFQRVLGGSHAWPGGKPGLGLGGEPTDAMDATSVLWAFLFEHGR